MLIVPLGHERTTLRRLPWVTIAVALLCIVLQIRANAVEVDVLTDVARLEGQALALEEQLESAPVVEAALASQLQRVRDQRDAALEQLPSNRLGYRPKTDGLRRMLTSAFAHGGWLHLIGNLLFLYLMGCNMEDRWGRGRYAALYLSGAVVSALAFRLWHPTSETPLVGASGAIAAVMGAFAICYATTKLRFFYFYWLLKPGWGTFEAAAWVALPMWFLEQALLSSLETHGTTEVAYSAHVGGFLFGVAVAISLRVSGLELRIVQEHASADDVAESMEASALLTEAHSGLSVGQKSEALDKLETLLERDQEQERAREVALALALDVRDGARVRQHAGALLARWARAGKHERVAARYRSIREQWSDAELGETVLKAVIACSASAEVQPIVIVDATSQLIRQHPDSQLLPRAMLAAADAQTRLNRGDLASRTLQNIVETFPMDPFAEKARTRLKRSLGPAALGR
jgi:membrane associated rhomboid family serine protease